MLKRYEQQDIARMTQIEQEVLNTSLGEDYYLHDLDNPLARHYVWLDNNQIIGFISSIYDGYSLEILNFGIARRYQHQGHGTLFLASFLDLIYQEGLSHISLEVRASNQNAIRLYQKLGFQQVHIRKAYYDNQEDALVYQKVYTPLCHIANMEAHLFSQKKGFRYDNETFKERFMLNYYDLYDQKVENLSFIVPADIICICSNWYHPQLFQQFEVEESFLLHVGTYAYQSLNKNKIEVSFLKDWDEYSQYCNNQLSIYGMAYAYQYPIWIKEHIQEHKMLLVGAYLDEHLIGVARMLCYKHAIFIDSVEVLENKRHLGACSSMFDFIVEYAKQNQYDDLYLEALPTDTPIQMYEKMNFHKIETLYDYIWKKTK